MCIILVKLVKNPPKVFIDQFVINTNMRKLKIFYTIGDSTFNNIIERDFGCVKNRNDCVKQDMLPEGNGPFLFSHGHILYIDNYLDLLIDEHRFSETFL